MLVPELKSEGETVPVYLGDGVYATFDGYQIWLRTSNGIKVTNSIALEPDVYRALCDFAKSVGGAYGT